MPAMNKVEESLLNTLEGKAHGLQNGDKGSPLVMSEVIAQTALVVCAMAKMGAVTPEECADYRKAIKGAGWKTALAVTAPIVFGAVAIAIKVWG